MEKDKNKNGIKKNNGPAAVLCCVALRLLKNTPLARRARSSPHWIALYKARRRPSKQMMNGVVPEGAG
jgi:hypothetical protein